jgi:GntR family transcriptional regulator
VLSSSPELELILQGGVAIQRQIVDQLRSYITTGLLQPGEQLPSVRAVAVGLAINPRTVEAAYAELEQQGYVTREEGSGIFVAWRPPVCVSTADSVVGFDTETNQTF